MRTSANLTKRLARIEARRHTGAPTVIFSDRPIGDPAGDLEVADALANWPRWVAAGKAGVRSGVLYLTSPGMTDEAWAARYVTAD
ncbi:hypothetical protein ACRAWG_16045 [Methylobacterium sp. P31]